jgi:hypothetical protein
LYNNTYILEGIIMDTAGEKKVGVVMPSLSEELEMAFGELLQTNEVSEKMFITEKTAITLKTLNIDQSLRAESFFDPRWAMMGDIITRGRKLSIIAAATDCVNDKKMKRDSQEEESLTNAAIREIYLKLGGEIIDCIYDKYLELVEKRQNLLKDLGGQIQNFLNPHQENL